MLPHTPHFLVPFVKAQSCCLCCCVTHRLYMSNTCCTHSHWDIFSFCMLADCPNVDECVLLCGRRRKGHLSSFRKMLCAFRKPNFRVKGVGGYCFISISFMLISVFAALFFKWALDLCMTDMLHFHVHITCKCLH